MFKVGLGYDLHRLGPGRALILGGIEIPSPAGLIGHSDGDALVHALIDALLGAMGEGDIGQLFPDRDPRFKDIRSTILLRNVCGRLKKKRLTILHVDAVVVAEAPQLGPYFPAMKDALCPILGIRRHDLGLKAKTNEGLGFIGRGKAAACWAVVLLGSRSSSAGRKA